MLRCEFCGKKKTAQPVEIIGYSELVEIVECPDRHDDKHYRARLAKITNEGKLSDNRR